MIRVLYNILCITCIFIYIAAIVRSVFQYYYKIINDYIKMTSYRVTKCCTYLCIK